MLFTLRLYNRFVNGLKNTFKSIKDESKLSENLESFQHNLRDIFRAKIFKDTKYESKWIEMMELNIE